MATTATKLDTLEVIMKDKRTEKQNRKLIMRSFPSRRAKEVLTP